LVKGKQANMPYLLLAFLFGLIAGLRTFTPPAVLWLMRHPGPWAIGLGVLAVIEYAGDLHPKAPPRTSTSGLVARVVSGAFVGWMVGLSAGASSIAAAIAGAIAAVIGAYGGLALRLRLNAAVGNVPAGLLEDAVAIAAAVAIVSRIP
jgi:uncharacterized membrane protein